MFILSDRDITVIEVSYSDGSSRFYSSLTGLGDILLRINNNFMKHWSNKSVEVAKIRSGNHAREILKISLTRPDHVDFCILCGRYYNKNTEHSQTECKMNQDNDLVELFHERI